ncbi:PREDICTED: uncharacterized protein LOC109128602 [Camelina sativa]|uniref:Uncharacterized protein LOC109128602 n=1 Tax=Camelina sativa TaxID=90675 RepID=A0ABM1QVL5_CAMSA|nr:PREDICTED: uncharacterized protein LOC109128602 [Camelina sativa]
MNPPPANIMVISDPNIFPSENSDWLQSSGYNLIQPYPYESLQSFLPTGVCLAGSHSVVEITRKSVAELVYLFFPQIQGNLTAVKWVKNLPAGFAQYAVPLLAKCLRISPRISLVKYMNGRRWAVGLGTRKINRCWTV